MAELTPKQVVWLKRLGQRGHWPDRPFLADAENSLPLMRMGLAEVIRPDAPYLSYAAITKAGREKLAEIEAAAQEPTP